MDRPGAASCKARVKPETGGMVTRTSQRNAGLTVERDEGVQEVHKSWTRVAKAPANRSAQERSPSRAAPIRPSTIERATLSIDAI